MNIQVLVFILTFLAIGSCSILQVSGFGTSVTLSGSSNRDWVNPLRVLNADGNFTSCALPSGTDSKTLRIVDFRFSLPSTSTIVGIQLIISKYASQGTFYGITDNNITLGFNNASIGSNKKKSGLWRSSTINSTYGNTTDTWGASLTPQMLNDPSFGIYISASGSSGPTITAYIDFVLLQIFYDDGTVTTELVTTDLVTTEQITTMDVTSGAISTGITTSELTTAALVLPVTTEAFEQIVSENNDNREGKIIGAAVGTPIGLAIIGVLVAILFFMKQKKKKTDSIPLAYVSTSKATEDNSLSRSTSILLRSSTPSQYEEMPSATSLKRVPSSLTLKKQENEVKWIIKYESIQLKEELGRGSSGVVYKGLWRNAVVAVKQLIAMNDKQLEAFVGEATVLSALRPHPNILQFHGACIDPNSPLCIVMEFMPNGNLWNYLEKHSPENSLKYTWMKGIAAGMLHLKEEGIVHRDLAARNILLALDLSPKISDFGMSRLNMESDGSNKTESNTGPLKWMSPENLMKREYSSKSDVWSFGVLIYEIIAQKEPYEGLGPSQAVTLLVTNQVKLELPENTPKAIQTLFEGCMKWDANERLDFESICKSVLDL